MRWDLAKQIKVTGSVESQIFTRLDELEKIRREEKAFVSYADTWTLDTGERELLCIGRYYDGEQILGVFNFSEYEKKACINGAEGKYEDLLTGQKKNILGIDIPAYGFYYLKRKK